MNNIMKETTEQKILKKLDEQSRKFDAQEHKIEAQWHSRWIAFALTAVATIVGTTAASTWTLSREFAKHGARIEKISTELKVDLEKMRADFKVQFEEINIDFKVRVEEINTGLKVRVEKQT